MKKAAYARKLETLIPHELIERNLMNRVLICDSLSKRSEIEPSLKRLIIGHENWILYDKSVRKRSWSKVPQTMAKPENHQLASLLQTVDETEARVETKRPELINRIGVVFHHDNARPHTSLATQKILREFG
ncbi:Histone-lysine N-methyltransferase SETMAR [Eumeta japonica]|uniref:Histone-lysine N-methyltransferase SETMAR n=1 Tax=Eumeta variegata TaxID=151549 RepID=A0A4C1VZX2_EUMVA|nr:Histone-lysine N-methyltransferase SETMAR [Eumeta japonica]